MNDTMLYLNPETGELTTPESAWVWPLRGCTPGTTAPVIVACRVHGRYEDRHVIPGADHVERDGRTLLSFGRAVLAAASGSCATYRRWAAHLAEHYLSRREAAPTAVRPLASHRALAEALQQRVPFPEGVRALAGVTLPPWPAEVGRMARRAYLMPGTGQVVTSTRAPVLGGVELPPGRQVLVAPCAVHGWDLLGTLPDVSDRAPVILGHYTRILIAEAVTTCDDYATRVRLVVLPAVAPDRGRTASQISALRFYQEAARAIHRVTEDVGWVVAEALGRIAGT